ncbi:hypothetical protein [Actinoplanes sp. NPDC049316]|uniref:hypothetical protein n=1 Tax=Actinoplanes sp. NPDC049316 TaxID=3154727 RepID=UPI00342C8C5E
MVGEDGVIRGPGGEGRAAVVARDDIADVIVAVLRDPAAHAGRTYDLTGPTIEEAYASRARYGAPGRQVDAWVSTYTAVTAGEMSTVDPAIERLTGRPARTLADVLR